MTGIARLAELLGRGWLPLPLGLTPLVPLGVLLLQLSHFPQVLWVAFKITSLHR